MKLKLLKNMFKWRFKPENILKVYKIEDIIELIHEAHFNSLLIRKTYHKNRIFNQNIYKNKNLSKIYSFYEVLNWVEQLKEEILKSAVCWEKGVFYIEWWQEIWWCIINNESDSWSPEIDKVRFAWEDLPVWYWEDEWGELSYKEFYLLMQIYFWLYWEEEYKKELEENEKNWKYDKISTTPYFNEEITRDLVEEYLKLQLMQKDTSWAFDWLKIEKIYDKDWDDDKNREHLEEINDEFGEEVIVED
jgi:hypothetical protein